MDAKVLARIGAIVFVAIAITATAIEATRKDAPAESWASSGPAPIHTDPLRAELLRCQALGEAGPRDTACLRAWAENRSRFLAPSPRADESMPESYPAPLPPPPSEVQ